MTVLQSTASTARTEPTPRPAFVTWGTNWRQRLRLAPLYLALAAADRIARFVPARSPSRLPPWRDGVSIVIPERDAPAMLAEALATVRHALDGVDEPHQVIVVANGTPEVAYGGLKAQFPEVEFVHADEPLGFVGAIERGVACARYDWTYLMNNDMTLDVDALAVLLPSRDADVFAVASQIYQQNADGRREETGFTDWYIDHSGLQLFHAPVRDEWRVVPHLCASGGAALFRTAVLRRYLPASRCYHPFYWEDVEWGVRAWRDGLRVLFAPRSRVSHRHRASTARFFAEPELGRIVQRNRWLFDARHAVTDHGLGWLMDRICDLPYESQREFARLPLSVGVFRARLSARRLPQPLRPPKLLAAQGEAAALKRPSYSFRLRAGIAGRPARRRMLLITPFAVFPPRHGGARRVAELLRALGDLYDVVLVTDEARLYDARSLAHLDGLYAVHFVQRDKDPDARGDPLADRIRSHCHPMLVEAVESALAEYRPDLVQVEHAELAGLVRCKRDGQRWILDLHDAYGPADFDDADAADRFESEVLGAFDAVTVCSDEDRALIRHPRTVSIRNGSSVPLDGYRPSTGALLLFMGPFRYARNLQGILDFARDAFPTIRAAHPAARLLVLGGDEAPDIARRHPVLGQPGLDVAGHRDDVAAALRQCTLTVNPLTEIRGSALKLVESLTAGRVCVGTHESARGFADAGFAGLVTVPDVPAMAAPIIELLTFDETRHRLERPQPDLLVPHQWARCLQAHKDLCAELVALPQA
jgi:GT2 family glycosyltransferase/glycosyltransferase involved in cell wall biosynthesis